MSRKLVVEIVGDASSLEKSLDKADKSTKRFGTDMEKRGARAKRSMRGLVTSGAALGVGFTAAQKGIDLATAAVKTGIEEWNQSQKVTAQTRSVLASMGKQAGITAKQVGDLATSIMRKTGIDDEAIAGGENLLLTFGKIRNEAGKGNDVFTQATKIMTDFSVRFGKDIPASATLVGKALNDPIKGLTSLSRVGVQFTEGQRKQIKALVDSGQTMKAQKVILGELRRETGGAAEAAGKTLSGQINIAKQTFNNWMGDLVGKTIPILQRVIGYLRDHWPEIRAAIQEFWASVKPTLVAFGELVSSVAIFIRRHWSQIEPVLKSLAGVFKAQLKLVADVLRVFAAVLRGDWGAAWKALRRIPIDALKILGAQLRVQATILLKVVGGIAHGIRAALLAGLRGLAATARGVAGALGHAIAALIKAPINAAIATINKLKIPAINLKLPGPIPDIHTPAIDPIPKIPRLAEGGIVRRPTLALIGERGPEAVLPLGRGGRPPATVNVFQSFNAPTSDRHREARYALHATRAVFDGT